jgi:hypothetical protein
MAYTLQAIVGDAAVLAPVAGTLRCVALPRNLVLIPLTVAVRAEHGDIRSLPFTDDTDEGPRVIPESLAALCRTLSARGKVAYVEAEIFGGVGTQSVVLAEHGAVIRGPEVGESRINFALRFLGVSRGAAHDEFDAVGLGRHRDTEEWLGTPPVP